jgi:signal transduction histidine kinase
MRLRKRYRVSAAISAGAVLLLAFTIAWSYQASRKARAAENLARELQQQILERALVRDEYFLRGETRAKEQLETKAARISELLVRASTTSTEPEEVAYVAAMAADLERGEALTRELVALLAQPDPEGVSPHTRADLVGRVRTEILRLAHNLYSRARQLANSASARATATESRTMFLMFAFAGVAFAMLTAGAFQATRLVERRVDRLRTGADRVAAGELDHRIAIPGDDELADLGRAFDAMAVRLQASYASIERSNRELESFSYSVSHDLRAPLRHITGFVGLLREHAPRDLDPKSQHYLDVIDQAATKMGVLIDDLLAFSRIGKIDPKREQVPLGPLVAGVVEELAPEIAGRLVAWEIGPLPEVTGDPAMLRQVLKNLLRNAVKFSRTRDPARIFVGSAPCGPGEVQVYVRDNGVGFDMKYAAKLFQVFQRLHSSEEFEGTGIGLAIVQRIVQRHGGRAWAESSPGHGATFWVSLPVQGG